MLYSNVNGYNNNSGLIYTQYNGLPQYVLKPNLQPKWTAPQPTYINEKNEKELLQTMHDNSTDMVNKNGDKKIKKIPNMDLDDGGFKNTGKVESQTNVKTINHLSITKKSKRLAQMNVRGLQTTKSQPPRNSNEIMRKFESFINSLPKDKFENKTNKKPRERAKQSKRETNYNNFATNYQNTNNDVVPDFNMI